MIFIRIYSYTYMYISINILCVWILIRTCTAIFCEQYESRNICTYNSMWYIDMHIYIYTYTYIYLYIWTYMYMSLGHTCDAIIMRGMSVWFMYFFRWVRRSDAYESDATIYESDAWIYLYINMNQTNQTLIPHKKTHITSRLTHTRLSVWLI